MAASWEIRLDGLNATAVLDQVADRLADRRPLMEAVGALLENSTRERFKTNVSPEGRPWRPSLRAKASGGPTLVHSGLLRDSITHVANGASAEVGTNKLYAGVHQFGAVIRAKDAPALSFNLPGVGRVSVKQVVIPARPFLGMSKADRAGVGEAIETWLDLGAAA